MTIGKFPLFVLICISSISTVFSQKDALDHPVLWKKEMGPGISDARGIISMPDGGVVVAANAIFDSANKEDALVIRYDREGNIIWQSHFGGTLHDQIYCITKTPDEGFIVAGMTNRPEETWEREAWIIKLDKKGERVWEKTLPEPDFDNANAVIPTDEGNFLLVGFNQINKTKGEETSLDSWILEIDGNGNTLWSRAMAGPDADAAQGVIMTKDKGFLVVGDTNSPGAGKRDVSLTKFDKAGNQIWQKTFGGSEDDYAYSIASTSDGNYALAGVTNSFGAGGSDAWIIKVDGKGNKIWDKAFGGPDNDEGHAITRISNNTIAIAGATYTKEKSGGEAWVLNIDMNGNLVWDQRISHDNMDDHGIGITEDSDGNIVGVVASRNSKQGTKKGWIFKLDNH